MVAQAAKYQGEIRAALVAVENDGLLPEYGCRIEDKGITFTVHFRNSHRPDHAQRYLRTQIVPKLDRAGLAWSFGRMVLEVRPPVAVDKGSAIRRLGAAADRPPALRGRRPHRPRRVPRGHGPDRRELRRGTAGADRAGGRVRVRPADVIAMLQALMPPDRRRSDRAIEGPVPERAAAPLRGDQGRDVLQPQPAPRGDPRDRRRPGAGRGGRAGPGRGRRDRRRHRRARRLPLVALAPRFGGGGARRHADVGGRAGMDVRRRGRAPGRRRVLPQSREAALRRRVHRTDGGAARPDVQFHLLDLRDADESDGTSAGRRSNTATPCCGSTSATSGCTRSSSRRRGWAAGSPRSCAPPSPGHAP